jgi:hypothetical protein
MRRRHRYCPELDDAEVQDGEHVRVFLTDAQRQRRAIADAVARDARCWAGHRPGQVIDNFGPALTMDGAYSTAAAMRDEAFARLCERSANAWRRPFADAPALNAMPPENYDQQKSGNGDDDDDNNNNNGPPDFNDPDAVQRAMDAREHARLERDRIGDQKWRTVGLSDPTAATRIEKQAEAWRHGK